MEGRVLTNRNENGEMKKNDMESVETRHGKDYGTNRTDVENRKTRNGRVSKETKVNTETEDAGQNSENRNKKV